MAEAPNKPKAIIELYPGLLNSPDQSPFPGLPCLGMSPFEFSPFPTFTPDQTPMQRKVLLPALNMDAQPIPVNPLQYHRILKRRLARSKQKPFLRNRDRPYLHESRHRHAVMRQRGPKGKFMSKSELEVVSNTRFGRFSALCEAIQSQENKL